MTTHTRVVIVGGGILGCSLAYHLAWEGWSDCVLLEKAELTSGSTWHAAGQVTHSTSSYGLGLMAGYAIELYKTLEHETGQSVNFHDCGSLRLAYTDSELDWLRYTTSIGAALSHPMEIVGPDEIRSLHPFYNLDGVKAALWTRRMVMSIRPLPHLLSRPGPGRPASPLSGKIASLVFDVHQIASGEWSPSKVITYASTW